MGGQQLVDGAVEADLAVGEDDEVVADSFDVRQQVRGQHHGRRVLGDELHQILEELAAGQRVEARYGFVEQEQLWAFADGDGQGDLGALAPRELAGALAEREAEAFDASRSKVTIPLRVELLAEAEVVSDGE